MTFLEQCLATLGDQPCRTDARMSAASNKEISLSLP